MHEDLVQTLIGISLGIAIYRLFEVIYNTRPRHQKTQLVFTTIINKQFKIKILSMALPINDYLDANLALLDHETQQAITDAVFSNIFMTSSDTSIFTADTDVDGDGVNDVVGVAEGTATLTVVADVTYTSNTTNQQVTETGKTVSIDVTVTPAEVGAETTDLVVTLSNPKIVPTS